MSDTENRFSRARLAAVVLAGAIALLACSSDDQGETPSSLDGAVSWVEQTLRYVPDSPEYVAADLYLANYVQLAPKFEGAASDCLGSDGLPDDAQLDDSDYEHMYTVVPPATPLFNRFPPLPASLTGFDDCDLVWILSVVTADITMDFAGYGLTSDGGSVIAAMESAGYVRDDIGPLVWLDGERNLPDPLGSDARDLWFAKFQHVGVGPGLVITAGRDASIHDISAAAENGDRSVATRADVAFLVGAVGTVDAVYILPENALSPMAEGWASRRTLLRARDMGDPRASLWASEWAPIARPDRTAVGYVRDADGRDAMKIALYYDDDGMAAVSARELRIRLETYGDLLFGEEDLCEEIEVDLPEAGAGRVAVGTCTGEWARHWRSFVTGDVRVLLGPVP